MKVHKLGMALFLMVLVTLWGTTGFGQVIKSERTYLDDIAFRDFNLGVRTNPEALMDNDVIKASSRSNWKRFLKQNGAAEVYIDQLTGLPTLVNMSGVPWVEGDALAIERYDEMIVKAKEFILDYPEIFFDVPVEYLELNADRSGAFGEDGYLWFVDFDVVYEGIPVEGARVVFRCNHGNLVQFGVEGINHDFMTSIGMLHPKVGVTREQALDIVFDYAGGYNPKYDTIINEGQLKYIPRVNDLAVTTANSHFDYPLVWEVSFSRERDGGTWAAYVDASTGELLGFWDDNMYGVVKGGVYPVSMTASAEVKRGLPFADIRNTSGSVLTYANSVGRYTYTTGTSVVSKLQGQYVTISDSCGTISMSGTASNDIDFGTSTGTDCSTPGSGGSGNTHAARSCFYNVNMGKYKAMKWLPSNTWLTGNLTAKVNMSASDSSYCPGNAWWDGSKINFCVSGYGAGNTGEIAAIFLHEFAHGLDSYDGYSSSDMATGETYADSFAFLWTHDSCGGPGFFTSNCDGYGDACTSCTGVREFDYAKHSSGQAHTLSGFVKNNCPTDASYKGPCGKEGHCESYPASEALWDLANRDLPYDNATNWYILERLFFLSRSTSGSFYSCSNYVGSGCSASNWHQTFLVVDDNDGNLTNGTPHASYIKNALARHGVSCSTSTSTNSGCSAMTAPTVTATGGSDSVSLSWGAISGASKYYILRNDLGCDNGYIRIASTTSTSYADNEVANNNTYYYRVVAVGSSEACFSALSACKTVTPSGGTTTYAISGTITAGGSGLSAVTVNYTGTAAGSVSTDSSGNYSIPGLANGSYTVTPSKTGYTFSPTSLAVTISGANQTGKNFTGTAGSTDTQLTSGVGVSGSVALQAWKYYYITVPSGTTKLVIATTNASADVDLYTNYNTKPTTASGTYTCRPYSSSGNETCTHDNPTAGTWYAGVYGYKAGSYTITATLTTGTTTYSISGTVSGAIASGVTINLTGAATGSTSTNTSGAYTFSNLANGSYTVTPSKTGYTFSPTSIAVTISGANQTGKNFTSTATSTGLDCSGAVALTNGVGYSSTTVGSPSNVTTYSCTTWNESGPEKVHTVTSNATGNIVATLTNYSADVDVFILSSCNKDACVAYGDTTTTYSSAPAGTYYVVVDGYNGVSGSYTLTVTFPSGGTTYSISGTVSGATQSGVTINLTGASTASTSTDASGNYSFTGLANGSYTVTPSKTGYTFSPTSRAVTISGANQTGQNFTASAVTYSISGTVSGDVVNAVTVNLTGASTASTSTNTSGAYTFSGLANGSYTVTPSKTGYTFSPTSTAVTISGANQSGKNFTATKTDVQLTSGVAKSGELVLASRWSYYYLSAASGWSQLQITTTSATGNVDLYARLGSKPTTSTYDYRANTTSGNETITISNPGAGTWWIGVYGIATSATYTVTATLSSGGSCGDLTASFNATYQAPACTANGRSCDAPSSLLQCRGTVGPEPNQPNTIADACDDGASGTCHSDESIESITIYTNDGSCLGTGKTVTVDVEAYCYDTTDRVTLFYSTSASSPSWTKIGSTWTATGSGYLTPSWTFTLSGTAGSVQAIRAQITYSADPGTNACYTGNYNDRDDLVFKLE